MSERMVLKVKRWLRGFYDSLSIETWHVKLPPVGEWFDVRVRAGHHGITLDPIYVDSLDADEVNEIVEAIRKVCEVDEERHYKDGGLHIEFKNCKA